MRSELVAAPSEPAIDSSVSSTPSFGITSIVRWLTTSGWECPRRRPVAAHVSILAEMINSRRVAAMRVEPGG